MNVNTKLKFVLLRIQIWEITLTSGETKTIPKFKQHC